MSERGNPLAVRVGPGKLYIAPLESTEPDDLDTPWDSAWVPMGYTDAGHTVHLAETFENVFVAEELDPILRTQTQRELSIEFALAEITARNLQIALNGGSIDVGVGITTFEPPGVGDYTHVMLGWEAEDAFERVVFRKCLQTGNSDIARQKAPNKATIPMTFTCLKPPSVAVFKHIFDSTYKAGTSS